MNLVYYIFRDSGLLYIYICYTIYTKLYKDLESVGEVDKKEIGKRTFNFL